MNLIDFANKRVHEIYRIKPVVYDLRSKFPTPYKLVDSVISNRPLALLAGSYTGTPEQIAESAISAHIERSQTTLDGENLAEIFCDISRYKYGEEKHLVRYENDMISGVDCLRKINDHEIRVYQLTSTPHTKNGDGKTKIDKNFKKLSTEGHKDFPGCKFYPIYGIMIGEEKHQFKSYYELYQGSCLWQEMSGVLELYNAIFAARITAVENLKIDPPRYTEFFGEAVKMLAGPIAHVKENRYKLPIPKSLDLVDKEGVRRLW